nr:hypothetical protein [Tanacetum cinerariifolium]
MPVFHWEKYTICLKEVNLFAWERYTICLGEVYHLRGRNIPDCLGEVYYFLRRSIPFGWKKYTSFPLEELYHFSWVNLPFPLVQNGPLEWPTTVEENGTTRKKKYEELSITKKQADCDFKAPHIVFQGLSPDVYAIINDHKVTKEIWDRVKLLMVTVQQVQGRQGQSYAGTGNKGNATSSRGTMQEGSVISSQHAVIPVIDDEETLMLEEVSRSKMLAKQKDPISKEKNNTTLINYVELNRLSEDFGKHFVPQQELSAEQAFCLQTFNPNSEQSVKKPITPDAITEGERGFKHTKAIFLNEVFPFLKSLKDIFNVFDKDLLNEVTEVQTVFNQMEAAIQQCLADKQCLEIHKKELFLDNNRLLPQNMSQDVLLTIVNSTIAYGDSMNLEMKSSESCDKCFDIDAELLKKQNAYNELLKSHSQLKKHCISLELTMELNQEIFQKDKSCDNKMLLKF